MTALASRRRRNTLLALVAGLLAAIIAPTLVWVGAKAISNSKAGRNALADVPPEQAFPDTPTAMLATVSDTNELTGIAVFVLRPDSDPTKAGYDQRGGSIVTVPINADAGGDTLLSLHDAYALGGLAELQADLESAINLTIDASAVMKAAELTALLGSLPAVQAKLPGDVLGVDDAVLFPKGPATLTTAQVAQILTTRSSTQPERQRRPNIEAVWSGIAVTLGTGRAGQTLSTSVPTTFPEIAARLTAGSIATRGLVSRPIGADRNPEGLDVEELDRPDTVLVFASIAPASMTRPNSGQAFRLEAPPGFDQQVRKTIGILMAFGGNVVSVDLNAKSQEGTVFSIYDKAIADAEPTDNPVFGKITVNTPDVRLGGVEETILLGTTYLKGVDLSAPDATSTTAEPTATTG